MYEPTYSMDDIKPETKPDDSVTDCQTTKSDEIELNWAAMNDNSTYNCPLKKYETTNSPLIIKDKTVNHLQSMNVDVCLDRPLIKNEISNECPLKDEAAFSRQIIDDHTKSSNLDATIRADSPNTTLEKLRKEDLLPFGPEATFSNQFNADDYGILGITQLTKHTPGTKLHYAIYLIRCLHLIGWGP